MKTNCSFIKAENGPIRVLKASKYPSELPVPKYIRQNRLLETWREKIWRCENKHLLLLEPQYRELVSKTVFSMEAIGLHGMVANFLLGLMFGWMLNGNVSKLQELIVALFNGEVFLDR